jgi:hypothetical protein
VTNERYIIMTVECLSCKTKQKIHVAAPAGLAQMGDQAIPCLRCNIPFTVKVPDKIIRGPFPV